MSKNIQKIISVTTSIATMAVMSGIGMLAPLAASAATINEGDVIRVASNPDVYIAKYVGAKKFKRLILNPQVFESYGHLSWDNIKIVSQAEMDSFTTSELVRALGDSKVYKLTPNGDIGTKQWMNMSAEAFAAAGNDWDSIYVINNTDRDNYTAGSDLTDGSVVPPVTGGAVSVSLASDTPAAGVAVEGGARIPFTKVNLTTGSAAASITGLTVQRTGLSDDLAFSSLVLLDTSDNTQVGLSQTLNSSHQVVFNETITIPANTTKSYMLAGNMAASLDSYNGQVAALSLVAVTTTATVSGVLPITGNSQTLNSTLTIGTATITAGSTDPGTAATKNIGTTGYTFSSLKVTAGSAEDVTVYSIKWNQSDSAASSDLANVVVSDGTTSYATTVSSDGKYYTANFGTAGVLIGKGLNKDFSIKGDILNGSARTISFDIYRNTDIAVKGNTYGYYMTPTFTDNGVTHATAQATDINNTTSPYFAGARVTIGGGSLRIDKNATSAPATNVTEGATAQVLGAFDFVVQGEPVNVSSIRLDFDHTGTGSTSDITSITLNKTDGTVLSTGGTAADDVTAKSGATLDATVEGHVSFSGTVTFPVGTTVVIVKGNLNTDFAANDTFRAGFSTPDARITSIVGGTTGNTITATPATAIWSNTMTIKSGSLSATISGTPVNQTVISGKTNYTFSNIVFDAGASGEDVKVTQVILSNTYTASTDAYGIQLFDGSTALTTGSNVVTPSTSASPAVNTFTLDSPLVIAKGTQKTIAVVGNILATAGAGHVQNWGFTAATTNVTATGVSTGQAITVTTTADAGPTHTTASAGQYSMALDTATPQARLMVANTTGNEMTRIRFKATSEQINVEKVMIGLTSASSTGRDVAAVYLYDGSTLLGSGTFTNVAGGLDTASASTTITLSTPLQIPANGEKVMIVKADIAEISTVNTVATAGHRISIDVINRFVVGTNTTNNQGTGASSGSTITGFVTTNASSTAQEPAYIYKSVPTVAKVASATSLTNASGVELYRFTVSADAKGDIDLYKFSFRIATTDGTTGHTALTNLTLVDISDSAEATLYASTTNYYTNWSGNEYTTATAEMVLLATPGTIGGTVTPRTVAAGTTKTFVLRGDVSGTTTGASISTQLQGDAGTVKKASTTYGVAASTVNTYATNSGFRDFIWSDWSDPDHSVDQDGAAATDWYNGYLVSGLPSSNLSATTLSR